MPPIIAAPSCLPDGGVPAASAEQPFTCDGPEDCPDGEQCYYYEYGTRCARPQPPPPGDGPVCHSDCDCPSGKHCVDVGVCR